MSKLKSPRYWWYQRSYYRAIRKEDFKGAMLALKKVSKRFGGLPPFWAIELAKLRLTLGDFEKAEIAIDELISSIDSSSSYNSDTKKFLYKQIERTHSEILKNKYQIQELGKIKGVKYIDLSEIDLRNVDPIFRDGWSLPN